MYTGLINRYREFLPVTDKTCIVSLSEGDTPLIRAYNLEKKFPGIEIYLKYDGLNPTGSFKDRGMTMAVTKALEEGAKAVICASTGNTSASAAAYAARANMKAFVLIPDNKIALGKLAQAVAYGADILPIKGNFDVALELVRKVSENHPVTLVNSVNPYRIEGQKSAAFEIVDALGEAPEYLFIPVGNAGNITAYWKGFKEYKAFGRASALPRLFGWQAAGAAPIVEDRIFENPETIATAIRIGNPASWKQAVSALEESNGYIGKRTDEEILEAYRLLSTSEGIFAEPASCISIAGLKEAYEAGKVEKGARVVCVLTGNGLKDPDTAIGFSQQADVIDDDYTAIEAAVLKGLK
jgi:threonine synthase